MIQFLSSNIWTTIKHLSQKSKRTKVAVAYFGTGGSNLLSLEKGDTLIVAMYMPNVRAGQVNPFEIQKLYDKGVSIYKVENLHSKIYLFDEQVIVGSANVSSNSDDCLIESGILTDDKTVIQDATNFIKEYSVEKVDQGYLDICKKNYKPPKFFAKRRKQDIKGSFRGQLSRLWVMSTTPVDWKDEDYQTLEKDQKKFERKISNRKELELYEVRYRLSHPFIHKIKEGDIVIEFIMHKKKTQVVQPKRVLGITIDKKRKVAFLRTEQQKNKVVKSWTDFERILNKNKIKAIKKSSTREIKNADTKKVLLSCFN